MKLLVNVKPWRSIETKKKKHVVFGSWVDWAQSILQKYKRFVSVTHEVESA